MKAYWVMITIATIGLIGYIWKKEMVDEWFDGDDEAAPLPSGGLTLVPSAAPKPTSTGVPVKPPSFSSPSYPNVGAKLYAKGSVNIRASNSDNSTLLYSAANGEYLGTYLGAYAASSASTAKGTWYNFQPPGFFQGGSDSHYVYASLVTVDEKSLSDFFGL